MKEMEREKQQQRGRQIVLKTYTRCLVNEILVSTETDVSFSVCPPKTFLRTLPSALLVQDM